MRPIFKSKFVVDEIRFIRFLSGAAVLSSGIWGVCTYVVPVFATGIPYLRAVLCTSISKKTAIFRVRKPLVIVSRDESSELYVCTSTEYRALWYRCCPSIHMYQASIYLADACGMPSNEQLPYLAYQRANVLVLYTAALDWCVSYVLLLQVIVCCFYLLYHGYLAPGRIPFHLYRPQDIYTGYCYIPWYSLRRTMESTEHSINIQYTETTGYWRLKSRPPPNACGQKNQRNLYKVQLREARKHSSWSYCIWCIVIPGVVHSS